MKKNPLKILLPGIFFFLFACSGYSWTKDDSGGAGDVVSPTVACAGVKEITLFATTDGKTLLCSGVTYDPSTRTYTHASGLTTVNYDDVAVNVDTDWQVFVEGYGEIITNSEELLLQGGTDAYFEAATDLFLTAYDGSWIGEAGDGIAIKFNEDDTGGHFELRDGGGAGNFRDWLLRVYPTGYIALNETPVASPAGIAGDASIFVHTNGKLSVRHGTGSILSLEEGGSGAAGSDPNFRTFENTDETAGATTTLETIDTSNTSSETFPVSGTEPGGITQGGWMAVAEIVAATYGTSDYGMYRLQAYGNWVKGASSPVILGTTGSDKDDGDGAGGDDCNFVAVSGGINVNCIGYEEYTGWVRVKFVGGGGI